MLASFLPLYLLALLTPQRSDDDPFDGPVVGDSTFAWGERVVFGPVSQ